MCSRLLGCATLTVLGTTACGQAPGSALPEPVAVAVAVLGEQCIGAGGTPQTDGAVRRADLNGDGLVDFVLYAGWIVCEQAWSIYGDREKMLTVFAGDSDAGATEALADWVYGAEIETGTGAPQLWLTTSAEQCGRPRAEVFANESFCERAVVWNANAAKFEYAPLTTVRMIE